MTQSPDYDLTSVRKEVTLLPDVIPMNNCSQAPQTGATRAAAGAFLESWALHGMDWDRWIEEVEASRAAFARLIGADPDEVAVATSVSQAVASLSSALSWEGERKRVVLTEAEFPTVAHVWGAQERRGAELAWVPVHDGRIDAESLVSVVDERTRIVSITHGYYQTGAVFNLRQAVDAAKSAGTLVFVDAYQTVGTRSIDVRSLGVDALAAGNLKFLMGLPGIAFLYVRRELAETLRPTVTGWFGRSDPFAFDPHRLDWADGARRFDIGTPPILPAYVARAGMQLIESVGVDRVEQWDRALAGRLVEGGAARGLRLMGPRDPRHRTPSTAFEVPDSHRVERAMIAKGVLPSARGPAIRLAPHFYNSFEDVDRALDTLVAVLAQ